MTRITRTALLLLALTAGAFQCLAQTGAPSPEPPPPAETNPKAWVSFESAEGRFTVLMPGKPSETTKTLSLPNQSDVVMHSFIVGGAAEYGVIYADYPWQVEGTDKVKPFFDGVRDMGVRGIAGRLLDYEERDYFGHPGRAYRVEFAGGYHLKTIALVVKNRLYMVTATTYGTKAPSPEVGRFYERAADHFIGSFMLTSDERPGDRDIKFGDPKGFEPAAEGEVDRLLKDKGVGVVVGERENETQPAPSAARGSLEARVSYKPEPAYPPIAKAARAQGAVAVKVLVDEEGRVIAAQAESGHPLLQAAAVKAAREARFAPAMLGGKPVKLLGVITYNFVLR